MLRENTIHHESANVRNSHYHQYVQAQNDPNNNLAMAAEGFVKPAAIGEEAFRNTLEQLLIAKASAILVATQVEPCQGHVNRNHQGNCELQGYVNFPPYQPCP